MLIHTPTPFALGLDTFPLPEDSDLVDIDDLTYLARRSLDSCKFSETALDQILDNMRAHLYAQGNGGIGVYASLTGALADIAGITLVLTPPSLAGAYAMHVGDVIRVSATVNAVKTGTNTNAQFRLRLTSTSLGTITMAGASNEFVATNSVGSQITLTSYITLATVEQLTIKLQGTYGATAGADVTDSWIIEAQTLRGNY